MENKAINYSLYLFEFIAVIFLVFVHSPLPGITGILLNSLGRFSVILFFVVSGYFLSTKMNNSLALGKKCLRTFILTVISFVLYFLFALFLYCLIGQEDISSFLKQRFNLENTIRLLIFNYPYMGGHLWFLFALTYCYLCFFFLRYIPIYQKKWFIFIPLAFLLMVYILRYFISYHPITIYHFSSGNFDFFRNYFFTGIPFMMIGVYLNKNKDFIINTIKRFSHITHLSLEIAFFAELIIETLIFYKLQQKNMEFYLSHIFIIMHLFSLCIAYPNKISPLIYDLFSSHMTLLFYLIHPLFIESINVFAMQMGQVDLFVYLNPFLSLFMTLLIIWLVNMTIKVIKKRNLVRSTS